MIFARTARQSGHKSFSLRLLGTNATLKKPPVQSSPKLVYQPGSAAERTLVQQLLAYTSVFELLSPEVILNPIYDKGNMQVQKYVHSHSRQTDLVYTLKHRRTSACVNMHIRRCMFM